MNTTKTEIFIFMIEYLCETKFKNTWMGFDHEKIEV